MRKCVLLIPSLGLVLGLNIYFRTFPIYFPQLKAQAKNAIKQQILQRATQDVYIKFPQFNPLATDRLIKERLSDYYKYSGNEIKQETEKLYLGLKDKYQDEFGKTYLMELDCWHWARYVDNVVRLGHPGDEVIYGRQWDILMLAPLGSYLPWDQFLYYLSAFLYKVFCFFKTVPLFNFLFCLPLFFTVVFIVSLYFFSYRYGGNIGAIISCLFVGLSPICLQRTCAGWFDKDTLNLIFPLLVVWAYLLAYDGKFFRLFWIGLSSFWLGLFSFNWTHWWFILLIIIIYEIFSLTSQIFIYKKDKNKILISLKKHILTLVSFLILSFFWIVLLAGTEPIIDFYNQIRFALVLNRPLISSIWPNVYSTVGELRRLTFGELAHSVGGISVLASSLAWMLLLILRIFTKWRYTGFKHESIIIMTVWFIAMYFAASRGVRFVYFLLIPLGVSLGWAISDGYEYFQKKHKILSIIAAAIVLIILTNTFITTAYRAASSLFPLIDDTWYKVLSLVKEKTPQDTVLNSWWDFGDWFKAVAHRRVIFDGQSQDTPQAYWMGKVILSNNEEEAVGILRMLNNGGNRAFEIIDEYVKDQLQSVLLLESVILFDREKAKQRLSEFLPPAAVQAVIKNLFSSPGNACFIVDPSMQFKMPAISYLGSWDFSKVYIVQNFNKREKDRIIEHLKNLGRNPEEVQRLYQEAFLIPKENLDSWISQRFQIYLGKAFNGKEKDEVIIFDNGFIYNPKEQIIYSGARQIPRSLFILTEDNATEIRYANANVGFSVAVAKTKDGYKAVFLDRELANSLFVRLYYFNGMGLKHFSPLIVSEDGENYIRIFKINW